MSKKKVTMRTDTVEVSKFVSPDNICQLIGCSRATAYRIIQKLRNYAEIIDTFHLPKHASIL